MGVGAYLHNKVNWNYEEKLQNMEVMIKSGNAPCQNKKCHNIKSKTVIRKDKDNFETKNLIEVITYNDIFFFKDIRNLPESVRGE